MTHCRLSNGFGTTPKSKPPAWMGVHKTVNGAYRYRYAPFLMSTYYVMGRSPLALPLGELSPQVTERVLQPFSNDKINLCTHITEIPVYIPVGESQNLQPKRHQELRTFRIFWYGHWLPSPSSLRSATSPKGRGKGCSHGTPKGVEVRPLSVRQIGVYCIVPTYYFV